MSKEEKDESELEDEDDEIEDADTKGKMEDVRMSNFAYTKTRIAEFMCMYFSLIGIGSSIISSEINRYYNENDINKTHIIDMMSICNVSTIFLLFSIYVN